MVRHSRLALSQTVGKRHQPLKRQGIPQQQGRGDEQAKDNPLRKCSPAREEVGHGTRKPRDEAGHGANKPFEKPFEWIVGLGPPKQCWKSHKLAIDFREGYDFRGLNSSGVRKGERSSLPAALKRINSPSVVKFTKGKRCSPCFCKLS